MTIMQSVQVMLGHSMGIGATTQDEAIMRAKSLVSKFPRRIKSIVT